MPEADAHRDTVSRDVPECLVDPGQEECPVCGLVDLLSRKWTMHLVWTIREDGPIRFNELKRRATGISPRVLSDRLSQLEDQGLVERMDHEETPPRVEYELTEKGRDLEDVLAAYADWAHRWEAWDAEACC